jgi:hypothetical protein
MDNQVTETWLFPGEILTLKKAFGEGVWAKLFLFDV